MRGLLVRRTPGILHVPSTPKEKARYLLSNPFCEEIDYIGTANETG